MEAFCVCCFSPVRLSEYATIHTVSLHTDLGEQNQQQLMFYHIQRDYLFHCS